MSKFVRVLLVGGLIGGALATWIAPKAITWYFDPPVEMGFNCKAPIEWALARLRWAQMVGTIAGALLACFVYFGFFRKKRADSLQNY